MIDHFSECSSCSREVDYGFVTELEQHESLLSIIGHHQASALGSLYSNFKVVGEPGAVQLYLQSHSFILRSSDPGTNKFYAL